MTRSLITYFMVSCCLLVNLNGKSGTAIKYPGIMCDLNDPGHHTLLNDYDVKFYFIDLEVNDSSTNIQGSASILVELINDEPNPIVLDMGNTLQPDSVFLNQKQVDFTHDNNRLIIMRPEFFTAGCLINIQVYYHGKGDAKSYFAGLFNAKDLVWGNRVTWSLSEPYSARNWFPCKQVLEDKADSVYVFITTEDHLKAGSNGILTACTKLQNGKIRHEWKSYYPIAYYLISFAVSNYRDYSFYAPLTGTQDSLLIQNYIYHNDLFLKNNKNNIDITRDMIGLFEKLFGPYPFSKEKYGHCIVPSGGGMEHQTMTTLENFSFVLVSHELAHQWFGNLVTCSSWQDIWINEGFASYAEYLCYQYLLSQEEADQWMERAHDIVRSRSDGSIHIPSDGLQNENRIFDYRLSYKKGAAMIHMIRHEINNDSLFFQLLKELLVTYRNSSVSAMEFKDLLEKTTNIDFKGFFDQWYYGEGYPVVSYNYYHKNDTLYIHALQTTTSSSTPLFNLRIDFRITVNGRDSLLTRKQTTNRETWKIYMPGKISNIQADPFNWLLCDISGSMRRDEINISMKDVSINSDPPDKN